MVRLLLPAILGLAALLRFALLGTIPGFDGDEGIGLFYARQVAEHGVLRLHPLRPYLGPYDLWLAVPFLKLLGFTPLAARLVPASMSVLATWLAFRLGRRWGGDVQGLATAALVGMAPCLAGYSRVALAVAEMPALVVIAWVLLLRLLDRRTAGAAAALGAALGAAVVFHPTGMLICAAVGAAALLHGEGRALARRPRVVLSALLGFAATGWIAWDLILAQVGLGPGVDLSLTSVDEAVQRGIWGRSIQAVAVTLDTAAGGRALEWLGGVPSREHLLLRPLRWAVGIGFALAVARAVRARDPVGLGLAAAVVVAVALTAARSAHFDLAISSRERYVLVPATLLVLLLPYGLLGLGGPPAGWRLRAGVALVVAWCALSVAAFQAGFILPMIETGSRNPSPSMIAAWPDAKLQAARVIGGRMRPGEEGLLLAGDGWSYWPVVAFLGERMPSDFVPEDPRECAATLRRTKHRRRFLVDYAAGHWNGAIRACLAGAGYGADRPPLFVPATPDGTPVLLLWELEPEGAGG